jgi:GntR family transcriptional regulator, vanillate catabolism transcriptional regulator
LSGKGDGTSQSTRALLRLRELILSGEFAAGTRMSELPLVERLGVSRTPLRLALATLEHEGLLELLPGGGYAVRQFKYEDVRDAIELRGVLEGTAIRLAAERGVSRRELSLIDRMDVEVHSTDTEGSFMRYMKLNESFHTQFVQAARSTVLSRAVESMVALPFASASAFLLAQSELPESREILLLAQQHHRGIVEALERREGTRGEALGREHARIAARNLEVVLEHRHVLDRMPGAALLQLPEREPVVDPDAAPAEAS